MKFGKRGWPLLASIEYRGEIVGQGPNGLTLTDAAGARDEFGTARAVAVDVAEARSPARGDPVYGTRPARRRRGGPGHDHLRDAEQQVVDQVERLGGRSGAARSRRVLRDALRARRTPVDVGLRNRQRHVRRLPGAGRHGPIHAGGDARRRTSGVRKPARRRNGGSTNNQCPGARPRPQAGGHLLDTKNAIAFAMDRFAAAPGITRCRSRARDRLLSASPARSRRANHQLTVYQHYVGTPVAIGAAPRAQPQW